jgi:hypothetical protein
MFKRSGMSVLLGLAAVAGGLRAADGASGARDQGVATTQLEAGEELLLRLRAFKHATVGDWEVSFRSRQGATFYDVRLERRVDRGCFDVVKAKEMELQPVEAPNGPVVLLHLTKLEGTFADGSRLFAEDRIWIVPLP